MTGWMYSAGYPSKGRGIDVNPSLEGVQPAHHHRGGAAECGHHQPAPMGERRNSTMRLTMVQGNAVLESRMSQPRSVVQRAVSINPYADGFATRLGPLCRSRRYRTCLLYSCSREMLCPKSAPRDPCRLVVTGRLCGEFRAKGRGRPRSGQMVGISCGFQSAAPPAGAAGPSLSHPQACLPVCCWHPPLTCRPPAFQFFHILASPVSSNITHHHTTQYSTAITVNTTRHHLLPRAQAHDPRDLRVIAISILHRPPTQYSVLQQPRISRTTGGPTQRQKATMSSFTTSRRGQSVNMSQYLQTLNEIRQDASPEDTTGNLEEDLAVFANTNFVDWDTPASHTSPVSAPTPTTTVPSIPVNTPLIKQAPTPAPPPNTDPLADLTTFDFNLGECFFWYCFVARPRPYGFVVHFIPLLGS